MSSVNAQIYTLTSPLPLLHGAGLEGDSIIFMFNFFSDFYVVGADSRHSVIQQMCGLMQ